MSIRITHSLDDLAADFRTIARRAPRDMATVVRRTVKAGERAEKRIAKAKAGPHGENYHKRITSEMTGPREGEWGPNAGGTPVGAGFVHGAGNTDSEASAKVVAPKFYRDAHKLSDKWFWPA